jgi:glyoxylase-like metal-dependent hydrolase (beta-lactamase superfamily II)
MSKLTMEHLMVGPLQANCFIVGDEASGEAVIIDPGGDGEMIMKAIQKKPWKVVAVLVTHAHFDHTAANSYVVRATGAPLCIPRNDAPLLPDAHMAARVYGLSADKSPDPDRLMEEGDTVKVGGEEIKLLSTPGHTPGGGTFVTSLGIFPGDVLFAGSIGRTDLPGGDFHTLIRSIKEKILTLPDDTAVYPGHGPGTTVGRERKYNPFLTG